jgi:dihydropteroate synthase
MAIVNCNGDSFYAPSRASAGAAVEKALTAAAEGADIIDIGGESTRPGSSYVSPEEELDRVIPVIGALRRRSPIPLSVDTRKAAVALAALDAGADMVNDISALEDDPEMGGVCAGRDAWVVLMHKKGIPATMQEGPFYTDVRAETGAYLREAVDRALRQGIRKERIILDPGIGFGKRLEDNLDLLAHLAEICGRDYPILVGLSRKSFIGEITGRDVSGRLPGTLAANAVALLGGAHIVRVHDVKETVDLVKVIYAIKRRSGRPGFCFRSGQER